MIRSIAQWLLRGMLLCTAYTAMAQQLPQGYFCSPLADGIALSATFAEFRANHFHGGLDMRTGGVVGLPVRAAADGYVCGIRISPWGGGKMLYIKHPNGYTSVYMHLSSYAGDISRYVLQEQYAEETYSIVRDVPEGLLPVRKGQVVAYSGNTGSSGGPHLHFELRKDGRGWNPLHFGLPYRDGLKPTIRGVRLYPLGGDPVQVEGSGRVSVAGDFYVGLYATDAAEGSTPRNGFDHAEVWLDGALFYRYSTVCSPLDSSRMVNAIIDYAHYASTRQAYLLTRQLPGGRGPWVDYCMGDGVVRLPVGSEHTLTVKVFDVALNCAERTFSVIIAPPKPVVPATNGCAVSFEKPFSYADGRVQVQMLAKTLYADDRMRIEELADSLNLSSRVMVQPWRNAIPPHQAYTLRLRAPQGVKDSRMLIVRTDNRRLTSYATHYEEGWYTAEVRDFGRFALALDTTPPAIRPVNFTDRTRPKNHSLCIKLSDDLGGIESYRCTIGGRWVLAEYDGKTATLTIDAAGKLQAEKNTLVVEATDGAGNVARQSYVLLH